MTENPRPELSVVVIIASDTTHGRADVTHLEPCLWSLLRQRQAPLIEILVPHYTGVRGLQDLQQQFPDVWFLPVLDLKTSIGRGATHEHHHELRARGLAAARGTIVALLEDHDVVDANWSASVITAHQRDFAVVGGAIENGIDRPLNWAAYFCDFGRYQNPLPDGEAVTASDVNVAYKRAALETIQPVWRQSYHEPEVNQALQSRRFKLALCPRMIVFQKRQNLRLPTVLRERFIWGRSYAATRNRLVSLPWRVFLATFSPALPVLLLLRMFVTVLRKKRLRLAFLRALPWTALLTVSWACGELAGYLTGRASGAPPLRKASDRFASPVAR